MTTPSRSTAKTWRRRVIPSLTRTLGRWLLQLKFARKKSILGGWTLRGTWEPRCINGSTAGRVFLSFLEHFLVPRLWPGAVVVMDNLGAHKVKGVREKIEAAGARLLYLSPYSADFNPIEMAWSKLKTGLRKTAARTTAALDAAIGQGWRAISVKDACGYFAHCGYL